MGIRLIYLEPGAGGFHTGQCRIFIDQAVHDPRIASLHFAVPASFARYAGANPVEIAGGSSKITFEYLSDAFLEVATGNSVGPVRQGAAIWREAKRLLAARPGSIVYNSMFDLTLIGSVFDRSRLDGYITGIVHFPPFRPGFRNNLLVNLRRLLIKRAAHYLASHSAVPVIFTFDAEYLKTLPRMVARYWRYVPDPIPIRSDILSSAFRSPAQAPSTERVRFLLFGSLGRRKGIFALLQALHDLSVPDRQRIEVVVAGEIREASSDDLRRLRMLLTSAQQLDGLQFRYVDRFLSDEEVIGELNACDVVLAPYAGHIGVSGVVLWAAVAGRPILTQESGWIGHVVRNQRLGVVCDTLSPRALGRAMMQFAGCNIMKQFDPTRLRLFVQGHSSEEFYGAIISALSGLPATRGALTERGGRTPAVSVGRSA